VRKTYQDQLVPTAEQEDALACVVRRCRDLYTAGLQERSSAWQQCGVSSTAASQRAQLPALKDVRPESEYREVHAQVLHDVLTRLDRAFAACLRRVQAAETPGYPRLHSANRYHSFTYQQLGTGATLDNGLLVLAKLGRRAVRWSGLREGGHAQDGHHQPASRWLVRLFLVCGSTHRAASRHRPGNRY